MNRYTEVKMLVIREAIKALKGVPSGELYARICGSISITEYMGIIADLKNIGDIEEKNYFLTWKGGNFENK